MTGWLCAVIGGVVGLPGLAFLISPVRRETIRGGRGPLRVAALAEIEPGKPLRCEVRGDLVDAWSRLPDVKLGSCWLVKADAGVAPRAFSTVCPHLGCSVDWDEAKRRFLCPCHQSYFAMDGKVISGPAPRDMDELEVITEAADVKVVYRRFRAGTSRKVEV